MDKEMLLMEIETIATYLAEYTVDEYRHESGPVQNAIYTLIDSTVERHIQNIGDELLAKYELGYYKDTD